MNRLKKAYCRTFQTVFKLALPFLPYRTPEVVGSVKKLPEIILREKCGNVLIITDKQIMNLGLTRRLEKALTDSGIPYTIYDGTVANPTTANVADALALYQENGCDAIIGFGGGSSMDCAKAVGARAVKPKQSLAQMKGILKVHKKLPLLMAVPTTAGTGSETTLAAVITDAETRHKYAINDFLPYVLQEYGESIHKKLSKLAVAAGICTKETPCEQAANAFIDEIKSMKQRFGIGNTIPQIREEDIPKLAHYADKEANPLYPVPVLMDAEELETFYHILMEEDYEQKEEHAL